MSVSQKTPTVDVRPASRDAKTEPARTEAPTTPKAAVLGRLTWMLFGPFVLMLTLIPLCVRGRGAFTAADFAYFGALGAMLIGRCVEFSSGHALTGAGEPATREHLRRYLLSASGIGVAVWLTITLIRSFWLNH
jgi:hypothetical protein